MQPAAEQTQCSTSSALATQAGAAHRRCLSAGKDTPLLKSSSNLHLNEERAAKRITCRGGYQELLSIWRPVISLARRNVSISSARMAQPQLRSSCSCSSLPRLESSPPLSRYLSRAVR